MKLGVRGDEQGDQRPTNTIPIKLRRRRSKPARNPVQDAKDFDLKSIEVPEWISATIDELLENERDSTDGSFTEDSEETRYIPPSPRSLSHLERLGPDLSASILEHLSVQEIAQMGTLSKAMYQAAHNQQLWKRKFQKRWNLDNTSSSLNWFRAYQQAYWNTDDLWIMHWNCVDPMDGLAPGRCCIQRTIRRPPLDANTLCPTCRYHPRLHPSALQLAETISTQAQAVAAATCVRLQQQQMFPNDYPPAAPYSVDQAERAFAQAATLHRQLSTAQYQSDSLHFLSDLLFFQVHEDPIELQDMKHLFDPDDNNNHFYHHPHEASATALHSWHLVHFTNPDHHRPLVWRISIMRKDCFTVYPSEGYLEPGQSQVVVFGVQPLASLLAHSTQQLNAHREGVDAFWANVYTEEAHLPPAPFLIHYHFATARNTPTPTRQSSTEVADPLQQLQQQPPRDILHRNTTSHSYNNTPWQRSGKPEQPVRIMYLSAHVNVNYTLSEFRRSTLVPFSPKDHRTLAYCAPQVQEFHPYVARILERWHLESQNEESVQAHAYRTEGPCDACGTSWGVRLEELGQALVVCQLECARKWQYRHKEFQQLGHVLAALIQHLPDNSWTERHHQVCVELQQRFVDARAVPWLNNMQRQVLCQWESITDLLCLRYRPTEEEQEAKRTDYFMVPWRHAGVYRHVLCTDSVFGGSVLSLSSENSDWTTLWKDEPKYLEAFAHLAHSPGRFCLGPQEDPNHLRSQPHSRYGRRQRGCVSDMFFDDPVCGLQAALCVVSDPRSLMVHGIWDRVPYPGNLIRRPKLLLLPRLQENSIASRPEVELAQFFSSSNEVLYYELQNTLDMETLWLVASWCSGSSTKRPEPSDDSLYPISLRNYLQNVPPPGAGRFPLCFAAKQEDGPVQIQPLEIHDLDEFSSPDGDAAPESSIPTSNRSNVGGQDFLDFHMPALNGRPGPRILNLLWVLSSHLGWTVDDNQGAASVYVDRRILIGAQWLSISLMAAPLFWTLVARYCRWIPATPVDYPLQALPFHVETELRFLSERECGYVSFVLFFSWLCLGRWIERYTSRDFFRAMLEHLPSDDPSIRKGIWKRLGDCIRLWCQRKWDSVCPLFLQRMVFVPKWNRRSSEDLMKHIAFWRSNQDSNASYGSAFRAVSGGGFVFFDNRDGQIHLGEVSWSTKVFLSILVSLASFSASSPHFFLNVLTVFSSSISLGLSMSLQSMETGRAGVTVSATGSIVETLSLVTIVILGFLVGQLVGSSGGVLFLAEFVVTSISLVLGGAGTISASAMESWGTFFCLAVTAFWGYLFGRVSIMEGIKQKRSGFSSIMLCLSLVILAILWLIAIFAWKWESPTELVILRPEVNARKWISNMDGEPRKLQ